MAGVLPLTEGIEMTVKKARNPIWWIIAFSGAVVFVLHALSYRGWNSRNRPPLVSGSWYIDDLRTEEIENRLVTFASSGDFDGDPSYGMRWRYENNKLWLRAWRLNGESELTRQLTNTTIYSWYLDTNEFPFATKFSSDDSVLTLADPDNGNLVHRLTRAKP